MSGFMEHFEKFWRSLPPLHRTAIAMMCLFSVLVVVVLSLVVLLIYLKEFTGGTV